MWGRPYSAFRGIVPGCGAAYGSVANAENRPYGVTPPGERCLRPDSSGGTMKIARMLGATAVLFVSLTLCGSPAAFANPDDSSSGSSSGSSSSGSSSSGDSCSGGHDSSGSSSSCDSDCQKKKDDKKKKDSEKKTTEPSAVVIVPRTPVTRAPVRQPVPVAPPAQDFVPAAPAVTPVLEQDAVSRGAGELLPPGATVAVADSSPTA